MSSTSPSLKASLYHSLKMQGRQIRLLEIASTAPEITCSLTVVDLQPDLRFSAMSYTWGDPKDTKAITVNSNKINIPGNLACALQYVPQHLDQAQAATRVWADAICINQDSADEKNHQVTLMTDIYSQADVVLCWLGPPSDMIFRAMDNINLVARERKARKADEVDPELPKMFLRLSDNLMRVDQDTANALSPSNGQLRPKEDESAEADKPMSEIMALSLLEGLQVGTGFIAAVIESPDDIKPSLESSVTQMQNVIWRVPATLEQFISGDSQQNSILSQLCDKLAELERLVTSVGHASNLEWLEQCPWLYGEKTPLEQKSEKDIPEFFGLPYWHRIWIFQEIVLGKQPIFVCGDHSLSLASLDSFASWATWIKHLPLDKKPGFIDGPQWMAIKHLYEQPSGRLIEIFDARTQVGHALGCCLSAHPLKFMDENQSLGMNVW